MSDKLQLKRYTIQSQIGEGGMADVYLAYDNVLKRLCAIKILKSNLAHDVVSKLRFRREADAAAKLQHPNIVMIYDVGESNNRPFIVMEYVNGQTLKELIVARKQIEKKEAIFLATQVADALAHAHEAGVIHRDVKPQNIMVKADGTVKITDFGIASIAGTIQLTQHDSVMGSVHYLAPECSKGEPASSQSDIYSLGIVLYEMLCGQVPFKGDSAVSIAMKHLQQEIPSVVEQNKNIEQSIENIIIKATAKKPMLRYQSALEMLADLKKALTPEMANVKKLVLERVTTASVNQETKVYQELPGKLNYKSEDKSIIGWLNLHRKKVLLGASIALLSILILISIFLVPRKTTYIVPNVTNLSLKAAIKTLEEQGYVVSKENLYEPSETIAKDNVVRTNPQANSPAKKGQEILLVLSSGKGFVIEDYKNLSLDEVTKKFESIDYVTVTVNYEESGKVKEGVIISQEGVLIGSVLDPNKHYDLKLVVSKPEMIRIPNVIGQTVDSATETLKGLGFTVEFEELDSSQLSDEEFVKTTFNTIIETSPSVNSLIKLQPDTKITISYYKESTRVIVNKEALSQLLASVATLDLSQKTSASIDVLELAKSNAQNVLDNPRATQSMVDSAQATLQKAIDNLKVIEPDVYHTVEFYDGKEPNSLIQSTQVLNNLKIQTSIPVLTYDGHKFVGWVNEEGMIVDPKVFPITRSAKFTASWEPSN